MTSQVAIKLHLYSHFPVSPVEYIVLFSSNSETYEIRVSVSYALEQDEGVHHLTVIKETIQQVGTCMCLYIATSKQRELFDSFSVPIYVYSANLQTARQTSILLNFPFWPSYLPFITSASTPAYAFSLPKRIETRCVLQLLSHHIDML